MSRVPGWLLSVALALSIIGCSETPHAQNDDQSPHFQRAQEMVNLQDFKGAISEFEKVLEANPASAETHFQLGCVCENDKIRDYGAAIYHYEKHLELKPDSDRAAQVHDRIRACKRELANGEFPLPTSQNLQKEVDQLTAENLVLKQQLSAMQTQLANTQLALTNAMLQLAQRVTAGGSTEGAATTGAVLQTALLRPRTYQVQEGDTISAIAARFKLKTSAVLAANPKVRPERLRVGQNLNLPVQ